MLSRSGLTHGSGLYHSFIRCCQAAGVETRRLDNEGKEINHVDVHSLRRTFATDLISNGADRKNVQELLGHKTLAMTMTLYAKIHAETKRQALEKLSYGATVPVPERVVELVAPSRDGHNLPTTPQRSPVPN